MRMRRRVNESKNLQEYKKGLWSTEEDNILMDYVLTHGTGQWNRIVRKTGLKRCGKSCRLRWMNYLSPNVKKGNFSEQEQDLIFRLYKLLGNRWSLIAKRVPGRTDNQIKNYCNTHLTKKLTRSCFSSVKTTEDDKESPPPLLITTDTTFSHHHQQGNNLCNNTPKSFNDVVSAPYDNKPKPDSGQSDLDHTFWVNGDEFGLSSLLMMDFGF